jgi:hypothetical protein
MATVMALLAGSTCRPFDRPVVPSGCFPQHPRWLVEPLTTLAANRSMLSKAHGFRLACQNRCGLKMGFPRRFGDLLERKVD